MAQNKLIYSVKLRTCVLMYFLEQIVVGSLATAAFAILTQDFFIAEALNILHWQSPYVYEPTWRKTVSVKKKKSY